MRYPANFQPDGKFFLVTFPDIPEAITQVTILRTPCCTPPMFSSRLWTFIWSRGGRFQRPRSPTAAST